MESLESRCLMSTVAPYAPTLASLPVMGPFSPELIDSAHGATVVSATNTQTTTLLNALDGNAWNNTTPITLPATFILNLGRNVDIRQIQFVWDSDTTFATAYKIEIVDALGKSYQTIADFSNQFGQVQLVTLAPATAIASFLRVTVTQASAPVLNLQMFRVMGTKPNDSQSTLLNSANRNTILYSDTDPRNPLSIFGIAITKSIQVLGQKILAAVGTSLTDHQKIVAFMAFLNNARIGVASASTPEATLLENIGACGSWSNTLVALATTQGITARFIGLYNYPYYPQTNSYDGHVVTEMFIDGRWEMFDPTYGLYYTADPANTLNPVVLSFDQLKSGMGFDPSVTRIVGNPTRLAEGGASAEAFASPAIYMGANPSGIIGPDSPLIFPVTLDLATKPAILTADLLNNQGTWILGSAFINVSQNFTLTGLTPGQTYTFTAQYSEAGGVTSGRTAFNATSTITGGALLSGSTYSFAINSQNPPWTLTFTANNSTVTLLLTHSAIDRIYLYASSYTLAAA